MIKRLPLGVEPFIFAPIQVEAHQFVSDKLIEGILGCDGVICMRGGYSKKSFWVAFEKDYALRAGKPVYNYSPTWGSFSSDTTKPLKLSIYTVNSPQDQPLVDNISEFMSKQRFFELLPFQEDQANNWSTYELFTHLESTNSYLILFWTSHSIQLFEKRLLDLAYYRNWRLRARILVLLPHKEESIFHTVGRHIFPHWIMPLYDETGKRSQVHHLDDVIVRLYWLVSQGPKSYHFGSKANL